MNMRPLLLLSVFLLALPGAIKAKEVHLKKGEVYRDRDLTVTCQGGQAGTLRQSGALNQPLAVRECQHWDDFAKKCLFEKSVYSYNDLECTEECQHWDAFNNTCDYQSKCTFYPQQGAFVLSTCAEFDDYSRKCLKFKEERIGVGK